MKGLRKELFAKLYSYFYFLFSGAFILALAISFAQINIILS